MTRLKVSASGQVYEVDMPRLKVTRDEGGGWYVHGRGLFIFYEDREQALAKLRELEVQTRLGGVS